MVCNMRACRVQQSSCTQKTARQGAPGGIRRTKISQSALKICKNQFDAEVTPVNAEQSVFVASHLNLKV